MSGDAAEQAQRQIGEIETVVNMLVTAADDDVRIKASGALAALKANPSSGPVRSACLLMLSNLFPAYAAILNGFELKKASGTSEPTPRARVEQHGSGNYMANTGGTITINNNHLPSIDQEDLRKKRVEILHTAEELNRLRELFKCVTGKKLREDLLVRVLEDEGTRANVIRFLACWEAHAKPHRRVLCGACDSGEGCTLNTARNPKSDNHITYIPSFSFTCTGEDETLRVFYDLCAALSSELENSAPSQRRNVFAHVLRTAHEQGTIKFRWRCKTCSPNSPTMRS
jgi:hypothetical protein